MENSGMFLSCPDNTLRFGDIFESRESIREYAAERERQQKAQQEELEKLSGAEDKIYNSLMACGDAQGMKDLTIALRIIKKIKGEVMT